jgi:hypothetical protein
LIALDLAMALDPTQVMGAMGLEPDPWQSRLLHSNAGRVLVNCHRQSGKSTTVGVIAAHTAVYQPGSLVLVFSPTLNQSQEVFRKCLDAYRVLDQPIRPEAESALGIELQNGSRIIALCGSERTTRGYSKPTLIIADEAAYVEGGLFLGTIFPMLAHSGRVIALSTPHAKRGWWYELWRSDATYEKYTIKASENPRMDPKFLREAEQTMGWYLYQQEMECEFLDSETQAFRREDIDRAFSEEVQTACIHLPVTDESQALARELQDYEIRVDQDANDKYGAFKVGTHDDLVTALGLAVLDDPIAEARKGMVYSF